MATQVRAPVSINKNQITQNAKTRRSASPIIDLNLQYQSDLHTQLTNQAWLAKPNSGFEKEKQKGTNCERGKRRDGNLATFADHHCIEGYNPIESDVMWKASEKFRWIGKGKWKRRTWSNNNHNHGDIIAQS